MAVLRSSVSIGFLYHFAAFCVFILDLSDIDNIVPGPEWGMLKDSLFGTVDYDFMHFTAKGHASLSAAIVAELRKMGY